LRTSTSKYKRRFELDVYANTEKLPKVKAHVASGGAGTAFKDIGLKSEINSFAQITAKPCHRFEPD
jgi:hypothetical protein